MRLLRQFPPELAAILICGLVILNAARPSRTAPGALDLNAFARYPVVEGGRIKPLDTVARTSLMMISEKQTFKDDKDETRPAIEWLLDVWGCEDPFSGPASKYKVFRIVDLELLGMLDLEHRPLFWRYSLAEIKPRYAKFEEQLKRVHDSKQEPSPFDRAVVDLGKRLQVFEHLARRRAPLNVPPQSAGQDWRSVAQVDSTLVAPFQREFRSEIFAAAKAELQQRKIDVEKLSEDEIGRLRILLEQMLEQRNEQFAKEKRPTAEPVAEAVVRLFAAARKNDPGRANPMLADFREKYLSNINESDELRVNVEVWFNRDSPFYWCTVLYVVSFVLAVLSWVGFTGPLRRAAFGMFIAILTIHTASLLVRMYLMNRPFVFVTNLYSSAIFIGWACAMLGLVIELIYRNGLGIALASVTGALSLIVAHFLSLDGDQLQMLQAVLDTNFWLSTHVTTVTLGYSATYMAGFFGIAYLAAAIFGRGLTSFDLKPVSQIVYGIVCFATLLSFVGTVLGGIWADQSWGRFWGWDPKENGALMIVIWNAMVLHARWAGMVKQRGMAVMAVFGCVVTTWSWFGTNQLGVGLHSYGFTTGRQWAILFTSLAFSAVGFAGMLPAKYWPSHAASKPPAPKGGREKVAV